MKQTSKLLITLFSLMVLFSLGCKKQDGNPDNSGNTVTDIDGNVYKTVTIGTQVWMEGNLKVKHYRNGDPITIRVGTKSGNLIDTTGSAWYYNNDENNFADYGLLYNWYAANDPRIIAPLGFHVPSDEEWGTLINSLGGNYYLIGGDTIAGVKLKEAGTVHWGQMGDPRSNADATNSSNWSGRPGGIIYQGHFGNMRGYGAWWASTPLTGVQKDDAYEMVLALNKKGAHRYFNFKASGLSVRCVKDKQ